MRLAGEREIWRPGSVDQNIAEDLKGGIVDGITGVGHAGGDPSLVRTCQDTDGPLRSVRTGEAVDDIQRGAERPSSGVRAAGGIKDTISNGERNTDVLGDVSAIGNRVGEAICGGSPPP